MFDAQGTGWETIGNGVMRHLGVPWSLGLGLGLGDGRYNGVTAWGEDCIDDEIRRFPVKSTPATVLSPGPCTSRAQTLTRAIPQNFDAPYRAAAAMRRITEHTARLLVNHAVSAVVFSQALPRLDVMMRWIAARSVAE